MGDAVGKRDTTGIKVESVELRPDRESIVTNRVHTGIRIKLICHERPQFATPTAHVK
jgi:hypothetical protein